MGERLKPDPNAALVSRITALATDARLARIDDGNPDRLMGPFVKIPMNRLDTLPPDAIHAVNGQPEVMARVVMDTSGAKPI